MEMLPHKRAVWTNLSANQSFIHRVNITKHLFCFQLANKSLISSLFISNLNQAAKQQESDPIVSWEIWPLFERESLPPNNLLFSDQVSDQAWILHQQLSRHFQLSMKLPQMQIEAWWDKAHLRYGSLSMTEQQTASSSQRAFEQSLSHSQCQ